MDYEKITHDTARRKAKFRVWLKRPRVINLRVLRITLPSTWVDVWINDAYIASGAEEMEYALQNAVVEALRE